MSQNNPTGGSTKGTGSSSGTTGSSSTGTGAGNTGSTGSTSSTTGSTTGSGTGASTGTGSGQSLTPSTTSTGTGAATGLAQTAKDYGQKVADAATTAKDYVSDKMTHVVDKIKDLQNADIKEVANQAKDYARQNPGQAILISAAAGLVLGLLIRGSRR